MSKRFYYPQQQGDRKKAKLDISLTNHNFPLSQNVEYNRGPSKRDEWGDDNDDEILLLASQACEDACKNNETSQLPDYSMCMQPGSTSTQLNPQPSTSKADSSFKDHYFAQPTLLPSHLKGKCNGISSPLPGISNKVISKTNKEVNVTDDFIFNDKVHKGQDSDYIYKQLLLLQEENTKLKSENGKLLEKCVTKEGEASILRTQLKSCQSAVDNVRLEKIKTQEKVQMEWNDKMATVNNEMSELRNQLDFKNLEIISIKEKCKKLESTKVKLTQVTVGGGDISQRYNNNTIHNDFIGHNKRVCTSSSSVQTDDKAHFMKLNKPYKQESTTLNTILSHILEPQTNQQHSILDYNEKLQKTTELSQNKCRIYSTFHRVPSTPVPKESKSRISYSSVYGDITSVASGCCDNMEERYFNIFSSVKCILNETISKLEIVSQRVTTAFQKEMDEKYIEATLNYLHVTREDLLKSRPLYKEEQDIISRRMLATLSYIVETSTGLQAFLKYENKNTSDKYIDTISRICVLLDNTSCAVLYSGLLLSIITLTSTLISSQNKSKVLDIIKTILISRPMPFVVSHIIILVREVSLWDNFVKIFCPGNGTGNLKTDYDQGVLLYKKDSCHLQLLLKQLESCLKCIEKQKIVEKAVETAQNLIILYSNINNTNVLEQKKSRCDCQLVLVQEIVYVLRICAVMLNSLSDEQLSARITSVCRCGLVVLSECALRDSRGSSALALYEGQLMEVADVMRDMTLDEPHSNMLSELIGILHAAPEDMPPSFHRQPWLKSFESFSLVD